MKRKMKIIPLLSLIILVLFSVSVNASVLSDAKNTLRQVSSATKLDGNKYVIIYEQLSKETVVRKISNDPYKAFIDKNISDYYGDNFLYGKKDYCADYLYWLYQDCLGGDERFADNAKQLGKVAIKSYATVFLKVAGVPSYVGGDGSKFGMLKTVVTNNYSKLKAGSSSISTGVGKYSGNPVQLIKVRLGIPIASADITKLPDVMWYSDNPNIASIYRGVVLGKSKGTTTIHVLYSKYPELTFKVTVK